MGRGQPLAYAYQSRPQKEPKEHHRNKTTGFLNEAYKLLTRAKRTKVRESRKQIEPHPLIELVRDQDRIQDEVQTLLGSTPNHKEIRLEAAKRTNGPEHKVDLDLTGT